MKKAKKITVILLMLATIVGGLWYAGIKWEEYAEEKRIENATLKETFENTEPGTVYVYSEEEIAEFKKEAQKLMDKEVKEFNLKYGETKIIKLDINEHYDFYSNGGDEAAYQDFLETRRLNSYFTYPDLSGNENYVYNNQSNIEEIFNKDFSLIKPHAFYGYTSVNNPSTKQLKEDSSFEEKFNYFVAALRFYDEKYKDSSAAGAVKQLLIDNEDFLGTGGGVEPRIDALYVLNQQWKTEVKSNSMNPLQRYLRVERLEYIEEDFRFNERVYLDESDYVKYEALPSEYNYWEVDESEYFTLFWPSAITKVDNFTYIVDIDTEKPVDRYGATIVAQNIQCRFQKIIERVYDGHDYFKVIVRIDDEVYHDMNSGIVTVDVLNGNEIYDNEGNWICGSSQDTELAPWQAWSPSEEARLWVDRYFSLAAEAYEADSYFSIFETIEQVAEEFDVDYLTMESIIMSCYWTYNGFSIWFY